MALEKEEFGKPKKIITSRELHDAVHLISEGADVGTNQDVSFFVGQERARRELRDVVFQSLPGTVVVMSEPLGAGKSFLIKTVVDDLDKENSGKYLRMSGRRLAARASETIARKAIFIEEFDIKESFKKLQDIMRSVAAIIGKKESVIVLSGDYSLRNPALIGLIDSPEKLIHIDMDALNAEMLKKAFGLRLRQAFGEEIGEINIDELFDKEFMRYLIPNTNPPIATMRTSFAFLASMANVSELSSSPAQFSGKLYNQYRSRREREFDPKAWHFVSWLHVYIRNHDPNVPVEALRTSELVKLYGSDEISEGEFPKILEDLARHNVLKSVGVPYLQDENNPTPEPYLPSQETFLDAMFCPLPAKTPREEETDKETAEKITKFSRLRDLYRDGIIEEFVFIERRNQILGLDILLDRFVNGKISREDFLREKKRLLDLYGESDK